MGDLFGVNDHKMTDLVFYIGLFGGVILTDRALGGVIETWFIRIILAGLVGMALGWGVQLVYGALSARDSQKSDD